MNNQQFVTIIQACIFAFEGKTEKEIMKLNPSYDKKMVIAGVKMFQFLQENIK